MWFTHSKPCFVCILVCVYLYCICMVGSLCVRCTFVPVPLSFDVQVEACCACGVLTVVCGAFV